MKVQTTRFGAVDIAEDRVITFPKGLLGFQQFKKYCLLRPNDDACLTLPVNGDMAREVHCREMPLPVGF